MQLFFKFIYFSFVCPSTTASFRGLTTRTVKSNIIDLKLTDMISNGYVSWPNFLNENDLLLLNKDLKNRYLNGEMGEAGIKGVVKNGINGQSMINQPGQLFTEIRKTSTVWLDLIHPKTDIEDKFMRYMDVFRMQLGCYLDFEFSIDGTEVLYALYPIGGFYKKHLDSHLPGTGRGLKDSERRVSFILYLNNYDWKPSDGGELRLYGTKDQPFLEPIDILPEHGKLVLFFSQGFFHEVMTTNIERHAVVGWFRVNS